MVSDVINLHPYAVEAPAASESDAAAVKVWVQCKLDPHTLKAPGLSNFDPETDVTVLLT